MELNLELPNHHFESIKVINLNSDEERTRLSSSAIKAFLNIASIWQINKEQAAELLGANPSNFNELKSTTSKTLDVDQLTRISYLIGLYKSLHQLYGSTLADKWVKMPNQNPLFKGYLPIEFMRIGGVEAIKSVKIMLDSRQNSI